MARGVERGEGIDWIVMIQGKEKGERGRTAIATKGIEDTRHKALYLLESTD